MEMKGIWKMYLKIDLTLSHVKCFNFQARQCPAQHQLAPAISLEYWLVQRDSFISTLLNISEGGIDTAWGLQGREGEPELRLGPFPVLLAPLVPLSRGSEVTFPEGSLDACTAFLVSHWKSQPG